MQLLLLLRTFYNRQFLQFRDDRLFGPMKCVIFNLLELTLLFNNNVPVVVLNYFRNEKNFLKKSHYSGYYLLFIY